MANNYVLSCCSTADMPKSYFVEREISYICFHYELDGVQYRDDLGESMPFDEFYKKMTEGADTKTSQINVQEFIEYFEPFLRAGKDVLHLTLSSGISGVLNSAVQAQQILADEYPDRKIYIVDSLAASSGYALLMDKLADMRDAGADIDTVKQFAEENCRKVQHWFFSTDLTFFIKGGRVSKTAGLIGGLLNICPLLNVNYHGKLIPRKKVRTKKAVIKEIVNVMEQNIEEGTNYAGKCFISNSACLEDAKAVAALIEERFPNLDGKVCISSIGTTIGSHTGPGTVAVFFWGKERDYEPENME